MAKIRIVGDSSGYVELAAPNAAGNNTLELPSNATKLVGADASNSLNVTGIVTATGGFSGNINSTGVSTITTLRTTSIIGVTTAGITTAYISSINDGSISGFRNLITNGEMVLDQRNSGSAVTINSDGFGGRLFPVDRFPVQRAGTIVITAQQDTVAPPNFQNSVKLTVTTADSSVAATDYAFINHRLEGYTASPLRYGTSAAKEATLSFWVRSSITGTYCIGISNYADNRAHVKEYTINSANTWEYKTITITGDTTGTWEKTNSGGMNISWTLLAGLDYQATANTWHTSVKLATSNQTQWGSTSSATFYLTGVQLELGNTASVFERRSYGQELALCQRYCHRWGGDGSSSSQYIRWPMGTWVSSNQVIVGIPHPVTMRTASKSLTVKATSGIEIYSQALTFASPTYSFNSDAATSDFSNINITGLSGGTAYVVMAGRFINDNTAYFLFSAEL